MQDMSVVGFDIAVAAAQAILAVTLLARPRRPEWAWPLAGIFLANAGQAVVHAITIPYASTWSRWAYQALDLSIFLLFVHLALTFPERPSRLRSAGAAAGIVGLLAAGLLGLHLWAGDGLLQPRLRLAGVPQLAVGYLFPAAAWALLLGRWAWRWPAMHAAHRATFQWLFAAFAMRAANTIAVTLEVRAEGAPSALFLAASALDWALLLTVLAVLFRLAAAFVQEGGEARRQSLLVLGFTMAGFLEAFAAFSIGGASEWYTDLVMHLDILVLRPLLVWCALALQDVGHPTWNTRWPGLAAVGALVMAVFSQGVQPGIEDAVPGWPGTAAAFAIGALVAAGAVVAARAWLASRTAGIADDGAAAWMPGQRVLGRYRVVRLLGKGSTGAAYLAHDLRRQEAVVLKRTRGLSADQRESLLAEADAAASLDHPRVVRLLRVEREGPEPVLVLEHAAGGSLRSRMEAGPITTAAACGIATDLLDALAAVHAAGLVHRDLKPENVFLGPDGRAKLGDFGSAGTSAPRLLGNPTSAGPAPGSLRYMSPEQVRGRSVDARSDLYALAVVLYELVAGRHPLPDGLPEHEARRRIAGPARPSLAPVPRPLKAVLARGLQKAPSRRFRSAAGFRRAVARAAAEGHASRKTSAERPTPSRSPVASGRHSSLASRSQFTKVPLREPRSRTA
jgi:hypothetical protein